MYGAGSVEQIGRSVVRGLEGLGYAAVLLAQTVRWLTLGRFVHQPVRLSSIASQMMEIGVRALPIVTVLSVTIGVMLAIQGIHTLRTFGAESQVTLGIALSVTKEFAPLITAILVAGRSGSALAARLGTMNINQEIDALEVMGINPVRFLIAPPLLAMLIVLPCLTFWAILAGLFSAGVYVSLELGVTLSAYHREVLDIVRLGDLLHGVGKSAVFAVLIALVAAVNGARVSGGATAVGAATTQAVVQSITAIVITDMIFVFLVAR